MEAGGMLDQDWGLQVRLSYLDFVYSTVTKWRKGQNMAPEESRLILDLTGKGLM